MNNTETLPLIGGSMCCRLLLFAYLTVYASNTATYNSVTLFVTANITDSSGSRIRLTSVSATTFYFLRNGVNIMLTIKFIDMMIRTFGLLTFPGTSFGRWSILLSKEGYAS